VLPVRARPVRQRAGLAPQRQRLPLLRLLIGSPAPTNLRPP
jgi:hypothetical protein